MHSAEQLPLSCAFRAAIPIGESVPTYEMKPLLYEGVVKRFGTHYFESATFGGRHYMRTAITKEYAQRSSMQLLTKYLAAHFSNSFYHSNSPVATEFLENTQMEVKVTLGGKEEVNDWKASLYLDPWLLSGTLKPIENLIIEPQAKAQWRKAVTLKLAKAYLEELQRVVVIAQFKLTSEDDELLEEAAEKFQQRDVPSIPAILKSLEAIWERLEAFRVEKPSPSPTTRTTPSTTPSTTTSTTPSPSPSQIKPKDGPPHNFLLWFGLAVLAFLTLLFLCCVVPIFVPFKKRVSVATTVTTHLSPICNLKDALSLSIAPNRTWTRPRRRSTVPTDLNA